MPRFVLLHHDCPPDFPRGSHWDLMLESGGSLRTWALVQLPSSWQALVDPGQSPRKVADGDDVYAESLGDHRVAYLDYEGPLSGERGAVTRVEAGTYKTIRETADRWEIEVQGGVLSGRVFLNHPAAGDSRWRLLYRSVEAAS